MKNRNFIKIGLCALTVGLLSSCGTDFANNGSNNLGGNTNTNEQKDLTTLQAFTGINMLNTLSASSASPLVNKAFNNVTASEDTFAELLPQLDLLLNGGAIVNSVVEDVKTEIDGKTYSKKETITYKDSSLNDVSYTLIYNEESFQKNDRDEVESFVKMDGKVLISETLTYTFSSLYSEESERGEFESERNFKVMVDERSYVLVEESFEEEGNESEREFEYTFINNGRKELEYSIEVENDWFNESIEFEVNQNEYEVEKITDKDGKEIYKVKIKEGRNYTDFRLYEKVVDENGNVSFVQIQA